MRKKEPSANERGSRPNYEKVLYTRLLKFREEQLENFQGPSIATSASDYHHHFTKPLKRPSTRVQMSTHHRRRSQHSTLAENVPHRRSSLAETEESYDPFRPSRNHITDTQADHARITIIRGPSNSSGTRRPSSAYRGRQVSSVASARNPTLNRVQDEDEYSIPSSPPSLPHRSTIQLSRLRRDRSRSSRVSSAISTKSNPRTARNSTSYKRRVSFMHTRKRSIGAHPLSVKVEPVSSLSTVRQQYLKDQTGLDSSTHSAEDLQTPKLNIMPAIRSRKENAGTEDDFAGQKARITSHYWKEDTRKVSNELEKLCDEAFKRASLASTVPSAVSTVSGLPDPSYDSPATSTSIRDISGIPAMVTPRRRRKRGKERPLPLPPTSPDHIVSETQRELANTRDLLRQRAADTANMGMPSGYLDDVIAHLDRLMQPSTTTVNEQKQRAVSTPDSKLPLGPPDDSFEMLLARRHRNGRAVSEPLSQKERPDNKSTIRMIPKYHGKPMSPIKPLTIRKKGEGSTPSDHSVRLQRLREQLPEYDTGYRSAGLALLEQSLTPIEEDVDKENTDPQRTNGTAIEGKKRGWFRRHQYAQKSVVAIPILPVSQQVHENSHNNDQQGEKASRLQRRANEVRSRESQHVDPNPLKKEKTGKGSFFKIFSKNNKKASNEVKGPVTSGRRL